MTIRKRIARGFNFVLNQLRGRAVILLYHRIAEFVPDPQLLCVKPEYFRQHLKILKRYCKVISLQDLLICIEHRCIPRRAVVITFDDGYVDNLWHAKPALEEHGCSATVFVVSGFVGVARELLSDELERILLHTPRLPPRLRINVQGKSYQWELRNEGPQPIAWDITEHDDPTSRHSCYRDLHRLLTPLSYAEREALLVDLFAWSGTSSSGRRDRIIMKANELKELTSGGFIGLGAHTVHHLQLARQPISEQRFQILESRRMLEMQLSQPVIDFAYPYGDSASIGETAPSFVREVGFCTACANTTGLINEDSEHFLLPRFIVRNWSGHEFQGRLARYFAE